ncbi:MAG: phosphoglycolate phosphatase [Pseudomonadota bacterium]
MVRPTRPKAVLCDLDGTLVDTASEIAAAVNDTLLNGGLPALESDRIARWVGHGARDLMRSVMAYVHDESAAEAQVRAGFEATLDRFRRHYAERTGTTGELYEGVRACLSQCAATGLALAVVTNKDTAFARKSLAANGILDGFAALVCGDTLDTLKPDPAGVHAVLTQLGCAPSEAVFIGDSSVDVETARRAGVRVLAFSRGYNRGEPIERAQPDAVFDHWSEVPGLLGLG